MTVFVTVKAPLGKRAIVTASDGAEEIVDAGRTAQLSVHDGLTITIAEADAPEVTYSVEDILKGMEIVPEQNAQTDATRSGE